MADAAKSKKTAQWEGVAKIIASVLEPLISEILDKKTGEVLAAITASEKVVVESTANAIARSDVTAAEVRMQLGALSGGAHATKSAGGEIAAKKVAGKKKAAPGKKAASNGRLHAAWACTDDNPGAAAFLKKHCPDGDVDGFVAKVRAEKADHKKANDETWIMKQVGLALWAIKANQGSIRENHTAYKKDLEAAAASAPLPEDHGGGGGGGAKVAVDEGDDFLGGGTSPDAADDNAADEFGDLGDDFE